MSSKEQGWRKFFSSRIFLILAIIAAVMVVFAYARAYYQDYQVRQEIFRLQEEARDLEAKKIQLLDVLKYVKSDEFVEEKARTEFNMIKQGEQVLVLEDQAPKKTNRQEKESVIGWSGLPNIIKWWQYFFGERN